jgi:hypothetical protein
MTRALTGRPLAVLAATLLALQLVALYMPSGPDIGRLGELHLDKLAHLVIFALPVWAWGRLTRRPWLVTALFALNALASEPIQAALLPARASDPLDLAADIAGCVLGLALLRWTDPRNHA